MRVVVYSFLVICVSACGVRKKEVGKTKITEQQHLREERAEVISLSEQYLINDSNKTSILLSIKPKGVFSYSIKEGFLGEAELLTLVSNSSSTHQSLVESELKKDRSSSFQKSNGYALKQSARLVSDKASTWWWLLILPLPFLLWLLKKRKQIFPFGAIK